MGATHPESRLRAALARAGLAAGGFLTALAVVEAIARANQGSLVAKGLTLPELDEETAKCASPSLTRGYVLDGKCRRDAQGFFVGTEPRGQAGAARVLVIGDSIAEEPWTFLAGDLAEAGAGRPVEVWNGAVSGYGTCQEAAAARELIPLATPSVVLVETCVNDIGGSPVLRVDRPGWSRLSLHETAWVFPSILLDSAIVRIGMARWVGNRLSPSGASNRAEITTAERCARDLVATATASGARLVVVHFPVFDTADGEHASDVALEPVVAGVWARAGAAGHDMRGPLEDMGPLVSLRDHVGDHIHPGRVHDPAIARIVAPWLVSALSAAGAP